MIFKIMDGLPMLLSTNNNTHTYENRGKSMALNKRGPFSNDSYTRSQNDKCC